MPRLAVMLAVFAALLCPTTVGWASAQRIVVLQPDDELQRAVSLALLPWGIETIRSDAPLPGVAQPEAARSAWRLARQLDVQAVVWMTALERGSLLWVYDVSSGDVTTRFLSQSPPLDSGAAAAVALSVKTVLRTSAVAPLDERFGLLLNSPKEDRPWAVEFGAGAQWIVAQQYAFTGQLAGVGWLPVERRLGLSLELSTGPGLKIDEPDFEGRLREFSVGARARVRLVHTASVSTLVALGPTGHWSFLKGTLSADSRAVASRRVNASIDVAASLNFQVSDGVYLGASLGAAYFARYQRYRVAGDPVFSARPWTLNVAGLCGVELF